MQIIKNIAALFGGVLGGVVFVALCILAAAIPTAFATFVVVVVLKALGVIGAASLLVAL